jgi:hypothetical protein
MMDVTVTTTEYEDLDALLKAPGWLRFAQHAKAMFGDEITRLLRAAVNDRDALIAASKMQQVIAAKDAVETLVQWPKERLAELDRATQTRKLDDTVPLSRRGTL